MYDDKYSPRWLVQLRYLTRTLISLVPGLYELVFRRINPRSVGRLVDKETVLVIEGFPRSANTWLTATFELALPTGVQIAHHTHAAAQVRKGVRHGLPVVLLIRRPRDAVSSLVVRSQGMSIWAALLGYIAFHLGIWSVARRCTIVRFETATHNPGLVLALVQDKIDAVIVSVPDQDIIEDRVREMHTRPDLNRGVSSARGLPVPHKGRTSLREAVERHWRSPAMKPLLYAANRLHSHYDAMAV